MSGSDKPLCKLKKDQLAKLLPRLAAELAECRYMCRRCARAAASSKMLCKPETLDKLTRKRKE